MTTTARMIATLALTLALLAPRGWAADASGTWTFDGSGNWSDTTKWTTTPAGNYPTGVGQSAAITNNTTANAVVTLDTNVTMGSILIGDATSNTYDVVASGGAMMTMDTGTTNPATLTKTLSGAGGANRSGDSFSTPLVLKSDLAIVNASGSAFGFTVNSPISESDGKRSVTCMNNNVGAIVGLGSTNSSYTGKTAVRFGIYNFASIGNVGGGNSSLGAPTNTADGTIDIGDGANNVSFYYTGTANARTDRILNFVGTTGNPQIGGVGSAGLLTYTSPFQFSGVGAKTLTLRAVAVLGNMDKPDLTVGAYTSGTGYDSKGIYLLGLNNYTNKTSVYRAVLVINSLSSVASPQPSSLGAPTSVANGTIGMSDGDSATATALKYIGIGHTSDRVVNMGGTTTAGLVLNASGYGRFTLASGLTTAAGSGPKTLTLDGTGEGELQGAIPDGSAGATALSKTGAGTWTLTADNSSGFSGTITINGAGGTLEVGHDNALNTGAMTLTAGNLAAVGAARTLTNSISAISSGFGFTGAQDLTLTATIPATAGDRTLYNRIASGKMLTLGAMNMADGSARTTTFEGSGDTVIGGVIANGGAGAGALTMSGTGTLTLKGTNTYSGATTLNSGTVLVDYASGADMPATALALAGGILKTKGAASGSTADTYGDMTVSAGGGALLVDPNGGDGTTLTLGTLTASAGGGSALFGKASGAGGGTVTITTATDKGGTGIYPAHTLFTDGSALGYDWLSTASGGSPYTLSGYPSGSYTDLATTAGTDTSQSRITGNTTMTGSRITNTLKIENPAAGQTLDIGNYTNTLTGGGLLVTGTNGFTITGASGGTRLRANNGSGAYDLIVHQHNSGGLTVSAVIGNFGVTAVWLIKAGAGKLTLGAANTFTGGTFANAGILELQDSSALGTGGSVYVKPGASVQLNGAGLTLARPIASLAGTGTDGSGGLKNVSGANTWSGAITVGTGGAGIGNADSGNALTLSGGITTAAGKDVTFGGAGTITVTNGVLSGAGSVTKDGAGTLDLAGVNTYTGPTTVNAGTLKVTGSIAAGSMVTVNSNATLSGSGRCYGEVRVKAGGTIRPEGGNLTVSNLVLYAGSVVYREAGTTNRVVVSQTGDLVFQRGLTIIGGGVTLAGNVPGGTYTLIEYSGDLNGSVTNLAVLNPEPGVKYEFVDTGTAVGVQVERPVGTVMMVN